MNPINTTKAQLIIENQQLRDEVQQKNQLRLDNILNCIGDPIFVKDQESRLIHVNDAFCSIFGLSREKIIGNTLAEDVPEDQREHFLEIDKKVLADGQEKLCEELLTVREGATQTIFTKKNRYVDDRGNKFLVGVIHDITERKETEIELEKYRLHLEDLVNERTNEINIARKDAEKANRAKSDFLSSMSHELRTPLNAILGFSQLLELDAEGFNETQKDSVREILGASRHLLHLINEVLDLAKIESGKQEIRMEAVRVDDILKQCVTLVGPQAEARKLEIIGHVCNKNLTVHADPTRLKQVLLNLLSNAVKYNCEYGRITLHSEIVDKSRLRISIDDTGNGLSEDQIAQIFTPYERMNAKLNVEGTGIGLVITKHLVELMNGSIGINSVQGKGSSFWFDLKMISCDCVATS